MSERRVIIGRMTPEQQAEHLDNLERADENVLALARLLQTAAFSDRPPLGPLDPIAPLYLSQATTIRAQTALARSVVMVISCLQQETK